MNDNTPIRIDVSDDDAGTRLDRFCSGAVLAMSRTQVQRLNEAGGITVDGRRRPDSYSLSPGEVVGIDTRLLAPAGSAGPPAGENIPIPLVYEDASIVVVNKPAGMVVHPAHGHRTGTLVNALIGRGTPLATLGSPDRPGVVHRLDKDTSGVMVLAKTDAAYRALVAAIKAGDFDKEYHGIAIGHLPERRMTVEAPIGRHPVHRQRMAIVPSGRPARSDLFVVDTFSLFDYIRVITTTGRTHQIRVHLQHVGHPLLSDPVYGGTKHRGVGSSARLRALFAGLLNIIPRHALHASTLAFTHPDTGGRLRFGTALPADLRAALELIYREDRFKEVSG